MAAVTVVGAGLAGLAAACHLVGAGHDVTVVERQAGPGGRAGRLEQGGFRFDTGPTVLTMPDLIAAPLRAVGADIADVLPMRRLEVAYRACFADGTTIRVRDSHQAMRAEIAETCGPADAAAFDDFVVWLRRLYDVEVPNFIDRNFNSPLGLVSRPAAVVELLRLRAFGRLGAEVRRRFRDPRLHRLFSFQAMYAGLAPDDALALYAVITYMDSIAGVYYPDGGMHAVPLAMAGAIERAGGEFHYGDAAVSLLRSPTGRVAGVRTASGAAIRADAVVCTIDLPVAYETLLADLRRPITLARPQYSPSAVVWHVGMQGLPAAEVGHHNIHFGEEWATAFDALLDEGRLMPDPSRLVTIPSLDDPDAAPAGASAMYILEPVPNLQAGKLDWAKEAAPLRDRLHGFLDTHGYPTEVLTEDLVTPVDWLRDGMAGGSPFALAHTFAQTGPFRPKNIERRRPGFFFAGSGTVPGVGVPMVLISGKLAAERVESYLRGTQ